MTSYVITRPQWVDDPTLHANARIASASVMGVLVMSSLRSTMMPLLLRISCQIFCSKSSPVFIRMVFLALPPTNRPTAPEYWKGNTLYRIDTTSGLIAQVKNEGYNTVLIGPLGIDFSGTSKYANFLRKCIWKCHLQIISHFVWASMW